MRTIGISLACLVLMLSSIRMQAKDKGTQPLWAVDLRPFSYSSRPNPHYIGGKAYIGGKFVDIGVLFPASDEVICYFVTKADAGQLVRRNESHSHRSLRLTIRCV